MKQHALIVDDDADIIRQVRSILKSLGHTADDAKDLETARAHLATGTYGYILLDLEIPVCDGELFRIENGVNLLHEIRGTQNVANVPVIVMTGHGHDGYELPVTVMKAGAVDYVAKPLNGGKLDNAIRDALKKQPQQLFASNVANTTPSLLPFSVEKRKMVICADRVTLCGSTVWQDKLQPDMRTILVSLSEKTKDGYKRIQGRNLLNRQGSNPVSSTIRDFKQRCTDVMEERNGLACGKNDVIGSATGGGYHFTEWMDVEIDGQTELENSGDSEGGTDISGEPTPIELNERQKAILRKIQGGERLKQQDLRSLLHREFKRYWSPATIKRDISGLKQVELLDTDADGFYILCN